MNQPPPPLELLPKHTMLWMIIGTLNYLTVVISTKPLLLLIQETEKT